MPNDGELVLKVLSGGHEGYGSHLAVLALIGRASVF